jgi:branched-chain amino acid transport system substrate-binding protein
MKEVAMKSLRLAAALLVCAACKQQEAPRNATVTLGQVIDRTGSIATPSWSDSIRLAVGTANQGLKHAGHNELRFAIAEANSGNAPDMSRAGALQVVEKQGAKAIITDSSQDDIAINMLAYDGDPSHALNVPLVCMACTSPGIDNPAANDADPVKQAALRNGLGWNFRTTMSDSYQARLLAHMLVSGAARGDANSDGHLKLGIYASDDPYGHGFSESLKANVLQLSPEASVEQIFHDVKAVPAEYPWAADVTRLTDKRNESTGKTDGTPDAVVAISFPKFEINFTRAWLDSGTKVRLVHTHNFRAARVLDVLSGAVEGQEGTSQAVLGDGNSARIFAEDLKGLTGMQPAFRDAAAYDAAMTLMLATVHAAKQNKLADASQVTGAMIRDSMRAINDPAGESVEAGVPGFARAVQLVYDGRAINYLGASGPCDFDAHGDVVTQLARFRVQAGQFLDAEKYDCVRDRECPPVKQLGSK